MKTAAVVLTIWLLFAAPLAQAVVHKNILTWGPSEWTGVVYRVYKGTQEGGPYTRIAGGIKKQTYTDLNVTSKQKACYRVTAYQATTKKESGYSPEKCGVTP